MSDHAHASMPLLQSHLPWPVRRGKVRDVYDLGDRLLIVATDRLSAFDWVLPTGIPDKGAILTGLSRMWFDRLQTPHHLLPAEIESLPLPAGSDARQLQRRSMIVRKTRVFPVECVVRGYLAGSGWKEYRQSQAICGVSLSPGLRESERLPEPIFTPATKEDSGHDENISFERMCDLLGTSTSEELRRRSLAIYAAASEFARERGVLIADTKFEFGELQGEILLIDEVLTPDSSRFWPADQYAPGGPQASFDKQFVRDWLERTDWDKNSPPPPLPNDIVEKTRARYLEAYHRLVGRSLAETS